MWKHAARSGTKFAAWSPAERPFCLQLTIWNRPTLSPTYFRDRCPAARVKRPFASSPTATREKRAGERTNLHSPTSFRKGGGKKEHPCEDPSRGVFTKPQREASPTPLRHYLPEGSK